MDIQEPIFFFSLTAFNTFVECNFTLLRSNVVLSGQQYCIYSVGSGFKPRPRGWLKYIAVICHNRNCSLRHIVANFGHINVIHTTYEIFGGKLSAV
jgi:hypothetical protein